MRSLRKRGVGWLIPDVDSGRITIKVSERR